MEKSELEEAGDLAGFGVDVDAAVSGVSSSTGHHGDSTGHGAQELGAAVLQNVTDGQLPAGGNTLLGGIIGQTNEENAQAVACLCFRS